MVTEIEKYLKLYWKLIKFSASIEMEYRFSFFIEICVELGYFFITLFGMRILFWNIQEVSGWNYNNLLFLYGINMIFSELILGLAFIHNLTELPSKITNGSLDLLLSKPISSQFAVSLWRPYFAMFPSILAGLIIAIIGFKNTEILFNPIMLFPFLIIFISGLIMAYSFGMIISTLSIWVINADPLPRLAQQFLFIAKQPYSIFTGVWKVIFLTIIPIAFMVSFPTQTLLNDFQFWWIPASITLAVIFLKASNLFWNYALKKYAGASS